MVRVLRCFWHFFYFLFFFRFFFFFFFDFIFFFFFEFYFAQKDCFFHQKVTVDYILHWKIKKTFCSQCSFVSFSVKYSKKTIFFGKKKNNSKKKIKKNKKKFEKTYGATWPYWPEKPFLQATIENVFFIPPPPYPALRLRLPQQNRCGCGCGRTPNRNEFSIFLKFMLKTYKPWKYHWKCYCGVQRSC